MPRSIAEPFLSQDRSLVLPLYIMRFKGDE